jgi:FG-GAP repeat
VSKLQIIAVAALLVAPLPGQTAKFSDLPAVAQTKIAFSVASHAGVPTKVVKARLRASNGHPGNLFGFAVAISGDTIVVASPGFRGYPGGAYVFVRPQTGWQDMTETAELTASDWQGPDGFDEVGISGDTIVAGPSTDGFGAYVFVRPAGGWASMTESALLSTSQDLYGVSSIAVAGNTIAVGYPNALASRMGAVAVFVRPTGGWQDMEQKAILSASDGASGDQLGWSVSVSGNTVVAGAPYAEVNSIPEAGAVYAFVEPSGGWTDMTQTAKLTPTYDIGGELGSTTSISDNTVVATGDANAYLFVMPPGGWTDMTPTAALESTNPPFGFNCAAVSGNVVVAGSETMPSYPLDYGQVYAFLKPKAGWQTTSISNASYQASASGGSQMLGYSVAVSEETAVAGAAWFDNGVGAAYVFAPQ